MSTTSGRGPGGDAAWQGWGLVWCPRSIWAKGGPLAPMELRDPKWLRGASSPGQLDRKPVGKRAAARGLGQPPRKPRCQTTKAARWGPCSGPRGFSYPPARSPLSGPGVIHLRSLSTEQESTQQTLSPSFPVLKWRWKGGRWRKRGRSAVALSPTLPHPTLTMWLGCRPHSRKSALENPPSSPTPATLGTSRQHS